LLEELSLRLVLKARVRAMPGVFWGLNEVREYQGIELIEMEIDMDFNKKERRLENPSTAGT
jgi:hypothetical protein